MRTYHGKNILGALGEYGGRLAGNLFGYAEPVGKAGRACGEAFGSLIPFKKGGKVKKTAKALLHKGEYVLPKGVRPTKSQMKQVAKRKRMKGVSKKRK